MCYDDMIVRSGMRNQPIVRGREEGGDSRGQIGPCRIIRPRTNESRGSSGRAIDWKKGIRYSPDPDREIIPTIEYLLLHCFYTENLTYPVLSNDPIPKTRKRGEAVVVALRSNEYVRIQEICHVTEAHLSCDLAH